jgi:hypothetical protein
LSPEQTVNHVGPFEQVPPDLIDATGAEWRLKKKNEEARELNRGLEPIFLFRHGCVANPS